MTTTLKQNKTPLKAKKKTRDICAQYGVSTITVWRWVRDGRLSKPQKINGRNYWPADAEPLSDEQVA